MARSNRSESKTSRSEAAEVELIERLVAINRVTKVVKGGRRFGFAVLMVVGDGRGRVGFGTGKAREVPEALRKATEQARRGMRRIPLREGRTIHHDILGRFGAGKVAMRTAPSGTGIIAGGAVRAVFEALGASDVVAKSLSSNNPYNLVRAAFNGLHRINSPQLIAARRSLNIRQLIARRDSGLAKLTRKDKDKLNDQSGKASDPVTNAGESNIKPDETDNSVTPADTNE